MEGPALVLAHGCAFDVHFDWLCARGPRGTAKHYLYKQNPGGGRHGARAKLRPGTRRSANTRHTSDVQENTGLAALASINSF